MRIVKINEIVCDAKFVCNAPKAREDISGHYVYRKFLAYFRKQPQLTLHNVIIGAYFTYGWMPTILKKFDIVQVNNVVDILNSAKGLAEGEQFLSTQQLEVLKNCINNSLVGPSKLLHFINPDIFAIWDSRVARYFGERVNMASVKNYMDYHCNIRQLITNEQFTQVHNLVNQYIGYQVSRMRACEYVMYKRGIALLTE